jgi:ketosteroid isomerase-like protein
MTDGTEQLNKRAEEWAAAELEGDTASLGEILTDDFVGVGPRGFTLGREQWLQRHETGSMRYECFGLDEVQIRRYGDAAVAVCRLTAENVYEDEIGRYELNEQFRATRVFVRQRGRWRLAGLQLSPILGRP